MGDVYALGATLAYAATGSTAPERDELPAWLRPVVGRCLARDPADRPELAEILRQLGPEAQTPQAQAQAQAQAPVQGFGGPDRSAALLTPGWLPAGIVAALAHQAATVLAAETPDTPPRRA
jgi:serine/threonine protein kinase